MYKSEMLFRFIEEETGFTKEEILEKNRNKEIVHARDIFILISVNLGISYSRLGYALNRDHTTIIHSYSKTRNDPTFKEICDRFEYFRQKYDEKGKLKIVVKLTGRYAYLYERFGAKCVVCKFDEIVEVHHIVPKYAGGDDSPENLVLLCPNHHALADRGMLSIKGIPISVGERI